MAKLARKGSLDQRVRNVAVEVVTDGFWNGAGLQQKDFDGEARRLLEFVNYDIRYVLDPDGVEMLHDPVTLLRIGAGDCDDKAILLASLLLSIGHTPRFVALAFEPGRFEHVWVQDYVGDKWVDLEPTEPIAYGQAVPRGATAILIYQDA